MQLKHLQRLDAEIRSYEAMAETSGGVWHRRHAQTTLPFPHFVAASLLLLLH